MRPGIAGAPIDYLVYSAYTRVGGSWQGVLESMSDRLLDKVFDKDTFIRGLLDLRQVGEHVRNRNGAVLRTSQNQPICLDIQTSARSAFAAPIVNLVDTSGNIHSTNHIGNLEEAEKRIQRAFTHATNKLA